MSDIILIVTCLTLTSFFILQERDQHYTSAMVLKGLASLCFVLLGFNSSNGSQQARLICAGLLIGMIADVLLALRYVVKKNGQKVFLVGILVFLAGHILYLSAVFPECPSKLIVIVGAVILTFLLMKWIFSRITAEKAFKIFGVVYIGAVVFLTCTAFANLFADASLFHTIFAAGCLLFLVSDIVMVLNTFGSEQKFSLRVTNLSLYYAGQLLIAISLKTLL